MHLFYVLGSYLEILDAADGSVVFAERVVEHDAGPLARGELGLAEEGDLAAFRAADPDLREEEEEQKRLKTSPPPSLLISSVYACAVAVIIISGIWLFFGLGRTRAINLPNLASRRRSLLKYSCPQ